MRRFPKDFWFQPPIKGRCILWRGRVNRDGYGMDGARLAHRVAYEATYGEIKKGLEIDHLCRRRVCVNPEHLQAVTHKENCWRSPLNARFTMWRRTHCRNGHPYDEANTYIRPDGHRQCRRCNLLATYRYRFRKGLVDKPYPSTSSTSA